MTLISKPVKPDWTPRTPILFGIPSTPQQWRDYLYWNSELENDNE